MKIRFRLTTHEERKKRLWILLGVLSVHALRRRRSEFPRISEAIGVIERLLSDPRVFWSNLRNHTHSEPTGVPLGQWADADERYKNVSFNLFLRFIEKEWFRSVCEEENEVMTSERVFYYLNEAVGWRESADRTHAQAQAAQAYEWIRVKKPRVKRILREAERHTYSLMPTDPWLARKMDPETGLMTTRVYPDEHSDWSIRAKRESAIREHLEEGDTEALVKIAWCYRWLWT